MSESVARRAGVDVVREGARASTVACALALAAASGSFGGDGPASALAGRTSIDPPAGVGAMAPALVASGDDWLLSWLEPAPSPATGHRLRFARWHDGAWTAPVDLPVGADLFVNWADTPEIGVAGNGDLWVAWLARSAEGRYDYDVELARSTDGGATFERRGRLNDDGAAAEHGFVSFAAEGRGLRAFWLDGRATPDGGPMSLRTALLGGASVGPSEAVDERVCDCCSTAAAPVPGGTAVVYRDRSADEVRDVRLAVRAESGPGRSLAVGADAWRIEGCPVNGPALAAAGREVWVAWFTGAGGEARVLWARSPDGGASLGSARPLDAAAPAGRVALAAAGADGAVVGWIGAREGTGELRLARLAGDGAAGAPLALAQVALGRASGRPRIARAGERIAIAWTEGSAPARPGCGWRRCRSRRCPRPEGAPTTPC